jgi:hypothetical protein
MCVCVCVTYSNTLLGYLFLISDKVTSNIYLKDVYTSNLIDFPHGSLDPTKQNVLYDIMK